MINLINLTNCLTTLPPPPLCSPLHPVKMPARMPPSAERFALDLISGRRRGLSASLLRGTLAAAEPFYSAVVGVRNALRNHNLGVKRLPRPVISVGNITAGGTGKTPVVQWLCQRLLEAGRHPAILSRGYKTADEPAMLAAHFGARVPVGVNPNRFEAGQSILRHQPDVDVFVLDDGFQHRKLHRDVDLVLLNAAAPFGYNHVHPRGLLREPLTGLRRASAILITHADRATPARLVEVAQTARRYHPDVPIHYTTHVHTGLRSAERSHHPLSDLANQRVLIVSGIGDPQSFEEQVKGYAPHVVDCVRRADHSRYTDADVRALAQQARGLGADIIVTTEKDWIKIAAAGGAAAEIPIWRVDLAIQFREGDEAKLFQPLLARIV